MDKISNVLQLVDSKLSAVLSNPYIMAILKLTLAIYGGQLAPKLPVGISDLLQKSYVKIFALFLIVYLGNRDLQLAIMLSIIYVVGVNLAAGRSLMESFSQFSGQMTPRGDLLEPKSMIAPGCSTVTLQQLVDAFGGDRQKLLQTVEYTYHELVKEFPEGTPAKEQLEAVAKYIGVPYNMSLERGDEVAPYIATMLMYRGFTVSDTCMPPQ